MKYNQETSYSKSKFLLTKINKKLYLKKKPLKIDKRGLLSIKKQNCFFIDNNSLLSIKKQNCFKKFFINDFEINSANIIYNKKSILKNKSYLVEFFQGKNGQEILLTANKNEVHILRNFYKIYFSKIISNIKIIPRNQREIKLKFSKIIKHSNFKKIKKINQIKKYFNDLLKTNIYKYDYFDCHGDFTLSNIIVNSKDKKIILIDFQNTYEENILQDFSKIYQEFILGWTSRNFSEINQLRSSIVYKSIISNNFWNIVNKKMLNSLKIEFLMSILRIVPYVKKNDKITFNWIIKSFNIIKKFRL